MLTCSLALATADVDGATCWHQEKVIVEIIIVVIDKQPTGVPEPESPATELASCGDAVRVDASPAEVGAGETGGGKLGINDRETEGPGSVVESVQGAVSLGVDSGVGDEVADSLSPPT